MGHGLNINNCYNKGNIISDGTNGIGGGIVGKTYGVLNIANTNNTGNIIATYSAAGFLADDYTGQFNAEKCFNSGEIKGNTYSAGFLAITVGGTKEIYKSYNSGKISGGQYTASAIANVSGDVTIKIENYFNTGDITGIEGTDTYTAGIIAHYKAGTINITNIYNTGNVSIGTNVGALMGYADNTRNVLNCYYTNNIDTIGKLYAYGPPTANDNSQQRNLENMKTDEFVTILNNGNNIWTRDTNKNNGLPIFI